MEFQFSHLWLGLKGGSVPGLLLGLAVAWDTIWINRVRAWRNALSVMGCAVGLYALLGSLGGGLCGFLGGWGILSAVSAVTAEAAYSGAVAGLIILQSLLLWKVFVPSSDGMMATLKRIYLFPFSGVMPALKSLGYLFWALVGGLVWGQVYHFFVSGMPYIFWGGGGVVVGVSTWGLLKRRVSGDVPEALKGGSEPGSQQVILLGMDALDWRVIDDLIARGKLGNFRFLREHGTSGRLESMVPTWSPALWTTIATGRFPASHGVDYFVSYLLPGCSQPIAPRREPTHLGATPLFLRWLAKRRWIASLPITSNVRRVPAFWNIASFFSRKVGILGWFATWPVEEVNGHMVTEHAIHAEEQFSDNFNYFAPDGSTYPAQLLDEIRDLILQPSRIAREDIEDYFHLSQEDWAAFHQIPFESGQPEPFFKMVFAQDRSYEQIAEYLQNKENHDLLAVYFQGIDFISHLTMKYMYAEENEVDPRDLEKYGDVLAAYYEYYDGIIGRYLEKMREDTTLFVVSDHGFERMGEGYYHHKNAPPGVLIAYGPGVRSDHALENGRIVDIAPTLLYSLGLPRAEDMEGEVLTDMFTAEWLAHEPPESVASYGFLMSEEMVSIDRSETDEKLKNVLRGLGYIE